MFSKLIVPFTLCALSVVRMGSCQPATKATQANLIKVTDLGVTRIVNVRSNALAFALGEAIVVHGGIVDHGDHGLWKAEETDVDRFVLQNIGTKGYITLGQNDSLVLGPPVLAIKFATVAAVGGPPGSLGITLPGGIKVWDVEFNKDSEFDGYVVLRDAHYSIQELWSFEK
ncbi:hypothetical protein B0H17DRAFT_1142683 [Mycena rosella]|uniref:Uncharacterized protein n=1 Tax=Mycena rosella TaxID=1033263 RepID=A0AAD7CWW2_MYCRO|nr:hypothetical protein B0H17DRAFT_1142683 [Mycena rosella]